MMNYYYKGNLNTHSRILCLENNQELKFSIGENFDSYNFSKNLNIPFYEMVVERLHQLRKKYSYLRLWFSGGKDSRLVLDTALKENIYFDEILTIVHQPAGEFSLGSQVELDFNAVRYINSRNLPKQTKYTVIKFKPEHYAAGFEDKNWIHKLPLYSFHSPFYPGVFFDCVNPKFNLVIKENGVGDISGSTHPHITWTGDNWEFFYVDRQFAMDTNPHSENFLANNDMPELTHAYLEAIINANKNRIAANKELTFSANRETRDSVKEYANINIPREDLEMPKYYDGNWYPGDARVWTVNNNYKHWVNCVACFGQDPLPVSMSSYLNFTDWSRLKISVDSSGIITNRFKYA